MGHSPLPVPPEQRTALAIVLTSIVDRFLTPGFVGYFPIELTLEVREQALERLVLGAVEALVVQAIVGREARTFV